MCHTPTHKNITCHTEKGFEIRVTYFKEQISMLSQDSILAKDKKDLYNQALEIPSNSRSSTGKNFQRIFLVESEYDN